MTGPLAPARRAARAALLAALAVLTLPDRAGAVPPGAPDAPAPDPRAARVVDRLLRNLGGADAPYRAERIAFTFAVEQDGSVATSRRHEWHPQSGRHRLRYLEPGGDEVLVDWDLGTRRGSAARAGQPLAGEALAAALERAWKAWVNDTYWLLMPYKLRDPGVRLAWDGLAWEDGRLHDRIRVTFEDVGLTPGDTYWAYVARDTGLMERWSFVLEGAEPPPVAWRWLDWRVYGPVVLSSGKEQVGGGRAILTTAISVR